MNLVEEARRFAIYAHEGQKDKIGTDYFASHVEVVAGYTREYGGTVEQVAAAYLHDTVEDTNVELHTIVHSFGNEVAEIVDALTKRDNETYLQFVSRCIRTPDAVLVKIADIRSNTDPSRVMYLPRETRIRQANKYANALPMLWEAYDGR